MEKVRLNEPTVARLMRRAVYVVSGLAVASGGTLVVLSAGQRLGWVADVYGARPSLGLGLVAAAIAIALSLRRPRHARLLLLAGFVVPLVAACQRLLESTPETWLPVVEGTIPLALVAFYFLSQESLLSVTSVRSAALGVAALLWGALAQKAVVLLAVPPESPSILVGSSLVVFGELCLALALAFACDGKSIFVWLLRNPWRYWGWVSLLVGMPVAVSIAMVLGIFVPEAAGAPGPDFSELSLGLFLVTAALVSAGKIAEALAQKYIELPLAPTEWASDPFFSVSADLFCMLEPNGVVLWVNDAFVTTLGYPSEALIGRSVRGLIHEEDRARVAQACGGVLPIVCRMQTRDGRYVTLSWRCTYSQGHLYAVATDITREREAVTALELANREATQALRVKADFLANMSHEIRTPLNGILGMAELLDGTKLDDEQKRFLSVLRRSGDGLLKVVNDILDFSKIEAGKLDLDPHVFCVASVIEQAVEQTAYAAHAKRLAISSQLDPQMPSSARGDSARLSQVLLNLLSNAVKFTETGSVRLLAEVKPSARAGRWRLQVRVADTGVGISEDAKRRLFLPFSQADTSTARKFGGTGLGLSISRRLIEKMEGEIGCDSEPGRGTVFWFQIELEEVPSPALGAGVHDKLRGRTILIRLADTATAEALSSVLTYFGAAVTVGKGEPGQNFDWTFVDDIAFIHQPSETRYVLIVPFESTVSSRRAAELSGVLVLTRPWRFRTLVELFAPPTTTAPAESVMMPKVVVRRKKILLAEDNPVNQMLAHEQLKKLGFSVHGVANGLEATQSVLENEYDLVFMDCQMPEMDGFEATRRIRQNQKRHLPIIAMTAQAMPGDREKCLAAGMDDYLAKPFNLRDLSAILERWLGEKREVEEVASTSVAYDPAIPRAVDRGVIAGLEQFNRGAATDMVGQLLRVYLQNARAGLLKMRDARAKQDFVTVGRTAHSLKSSSANVGAVRLSGILIGVENQARQAEVPIAEIDAELHRLDAEWARVEGELEALLRERQTRPAA